MNEIFKIQLKMMREEIAALYAIRAELEIMNAVNNTRISNFNGEKYNIVQTRDMLDNFIKSKMKTIDNLIDEVKDDNT